VAEPKRWLEGGSDAPEGALELLSAARAMPEMPRVAHEQALAQTATLTATSGTLAPGLGGLVPTQGLSLATLALGSAAIAAAIAQGVGHGSQSLREHASPQKAVAATEQARPAASRHEDGMGEEPPEVLSVEALPLVGAGTPEAVKPDKTASLSAELALVERARALLADRPARALAIARQHQERFPEGQMRAAADVIAVEALQRLGRMEEAAETARAAAARDPQGIYAERLRRGAHVPSSSD
jgi:hypothetical protein